MLIIIFELFRLEFDCRDRQVADTNFRRLVCMQCFYSVFMSCLEVHVIMTVLHFVAFGHLTHLLLLSARALRIVILEDDC